MLKAFEKTLKITKDTILTNNHHNKYFGCNSCNPNYPKIVLKYLNLSNLP